MAHNKLIREFFEDYIDAGKDASKVEGAIDILKDNISRTQELIDIYDQIKIYEGPANDLRAMVRDWEEALAEAEKALAKLKAKENEFSKSVNDIILESFEPTLK